MARVHPQGYGESAKVEALMAIAHAVDRLAASIERLGLNGADTGMGAIEVLAKAIRGQSDAAAPDED